MFASSSTFLVTLEPLVDKYARGLARSKEFSGDAFQPLGFHHPRGLILPFAVGPSDQPARVVTFNVGKNAGCSSLLPTVHGRLGWCKTVSERRDVPLVTLERILGLIGSHRAVDFVKIDGTEQRSYCPTLRSTHLELYTIMNYYPSRCPIPHSLVSTLSSSSSRSARHGPLRHLERRRAAVARACVHARGQFRPLPANVLGAAEMHGSTPAGPHARVRACVAPAAVRSFLQLDAPLEAVRVGVRDGRSLPCARRERWTVRAVS